MPLDHLRLWVMRIHPIVVRSLLRPLAVQLRQLLPCRRCDPRFLGQSPQKLLVALARIPSHNRAHGCVRFQRRAIDAHRLPLAAALSPPVTPVPTGTPFDAFPPRSAAACARSWSDLAAARSAPVLDIGAAPANPPPATRCHAPPQPLRNIRSAASENTAPPSAKDAPSPTRSSPHTAPLQPRRP